MSEIGIVSGNLYYSVSLYFLRIILTGIVILLDIHFKECPLNSKISYGIFFLGKLNITNPYTFVPNLKFHIRKHISCNT